MQDKENTEYNFEEIDLIDLLRTLINKKIFIISFTSVISILAVIYSLLLPNIYQSQALLTIVEPQKSIGSNLQRFSGIASFAGISLPGQSDATTATKALEKVNSLSFFEESILPFIFLPDLMAVKSWDPKSNSILYDEDIYDKSNNIWVTDSSKKPPSVQERFKAFKGNHFSISKNKNTGFITLSIKHQSPYVAKDWVELIVEQLNSYYRKKDKIESEKAIKFLNKQISNTGYAEIKIVISELLQEQTQKLTLIEVNDFYVFDYIDPPAVMEKKSDPKRATICILAALFGGFISIIIVIINYIRSKIQFF